MTVTTVEVRHGQPHPWVLEQVNGFLEACLGEKDSGKRCRHVTDEYIRQGGRLHMAAWVPRLITCAPRPNRRRCFGDLYEQPNNRRCDKCKSYIGMTTTAAFLGTISLTSTDGEEAQNPLVFAYDVCNPCLKEVQA